jgi:hypothetical protein
VAIRVNFTVKYLLYTPGIFLIMKKPEIKKLDLHVCFVELSEHVG